LISGADPIWNLIILGRHYQHAISLGAFLGASTKIELALTFQYQIVDYLIRRTLSPPVHNPATSGAIRKALRNQGFSFSFMAAKSMSPNIPRS
jgi:hypothetical protein